MEGFIHRYLRDDQFVEKDDPKTRRNPYAVALAECPGISGSKHFD
jgi:hypothetical protein